MKKLSKTGFALLATCCLFTACNKTQPEQGFKTIAQESKVERVKIIEIPACKMIKSKEFRWENSDSFSIMREFWQKVASRHEDIFSRDFAGYNQKTRNFYWCFFALNNDIGKFDISGYEVIDFQGGYYATATSIDNNSESFDQTFNEIKNWIEQTKSFELDLENRDRLTQMPIADNAEFKKAMGYEQLAIFIPIKIK